MHTYARTDYTREEIEYDRALPKKAGIVNGQEGKLAYIVRDLAIHKLTSPRELPARDHSKRTSLPSRYGQVSSQDNEAPAPSTSVY